MTPQTRYGPIPAILFFAIFTVSCSGETTRRGGSGGCTSQADTADFVDFGNITDGGHVFQSVSVDGSRDSQIEVTSMTGSGVFITGSISQSPDGCGLLVIRADVQGVGPSEGTVTFSIDGAPVTIAWRANRIPPFTPDAGLTD